MLHFDEARQNAITALEAILAKAPKGSKAVLVDDLFGRIRLVLWCGKKVATQDLRNEIEERLRRESGRYWTGDVWLAQGAGETVSPADQRVYNAAWDDAAPPAATTRLRVLDRHRNRGAWFMPFDCPWPAPSDPGTGTGPPAIVVFYSFKGGVGRSTSLASFAIQRARRGERVAVIDADLDAPGIGSLLTAADGTTATWGVVDYLLERPRGEVELRDYYHACRRDALTGSGEILVFPAGRIDHGYLGKLARIDLEPNPAATQPHPFRQLLDAVRGELQPHWILVDARAGLADAAGMLLGGLAHLHVLFGTFSEQSWQGLRLVLERLGKERLERGSKLQADCLLVHAMVPENVQAAEDATRNFADRARDELVELYFQEDPETVDVSTDRAWTVSDAGSRDAPNVPIPIPYTAVLADYASIDAVAPHLTESPAHRHLAARIAARFGER